MKAQGIRETYDKTAASYDLKLSIIEYVVGARRLRQDLLKKSHGRVLDVACGTGRNFEFYPDNCQITGIDLSSAMLEKAKKRVQDLGLNIELIIQDVENLDFPSQSFDTVVSSLAVCTYPDPIKALQEMSRVCKSDGQLLLVEHGRSSWPLLARAQDMFAARYAKHSGCHINREPRNLAESAGLKIQASRRSFLGILHTIEAKPCT